MFRNESTAVVRKAKAREGLRTQATVSSGSAASSTIPGQSKIAQRESTSVETASSDSTQLGIMAIKLHDNMFPSPHSIHNLAPSLEERATGFFFQTYVIGISGPAQWTEGAPAALHRAGLIDPSLNVCMQAVGLAGFSNISGSPGLLKEARKNYTIALRLTNAALGSPIEAKKDSTLLAIMILGLFETVTGQNQKSLTAWAQHINGAAALVKFRGLSQFNTVAGLRMFIQVTSSLLVSCIQRELPLPDHILELRQEAAKYIDTTDLAWQVQENCIKFAAFRARVKDDGLQDPGEMLSSALEIDARFVAIFSDPPESWRYQVIHTAADKDTIFNGYYHIYEDYWIAQIWNAMRTCRILLCEIIRNELLSGFTASPPRYLTQECSSQFQAASDALSILRDEILASVPQHVGYLERAKEFATPPVSPSRPSGYAQTTLAHPSSQINTYTPGYVPTRGDFEPGLPENLPVLRGSAGYFLLWPLYLVGAMDISTGRIQVWVANCLRSIGRCMGIQQAITLAGFLERKEQIAAWRREQKTMAAATVVKVSPSTPPKPRETLFAASEEKDPALIGANGEMPNNNDAMGSQT
jgi:hypothetical protein